MAPTRFRSRFLHATFVSHIRTHLTGLGWITPPINFGTGAVTLIDYQPDERVDPIKQNTVAVSLDDFEVDEDEELGARHGGTRSAPYNVYVDVYMAKQALAQAICDDIRDIFTDLTLPLINEITGAPTGDLIEIESVRGPERQTAASAEDFRRFWRTMRLDSRLYFQTLDD